MNHDPSAPAKAQEPEAFARLRQDLGDPPPPVIMFCKSHSGSRLLARLLMAGGVWLGDDRNASEDSAALLEIVELVVARYYPSTGDLFRSPDAELMAIAKRVLKAHLRGRPAHAPWGWKLCETGYALPLFKAIFPDAHFVHLIRDGRDVAFCDHVAPETAFWRKVYFATDRIESWRGRALNGRSYRRSPHIFNAQHWVSSVTTARAYGATIGSRYLEIRYEDLIDDPVGETQTLFRAFGLPMEAGAVGRVASEVRDTSMGKFRRMPRAWQRASRAVLSPTLESFGYGLEDQPEPYPYHRLLDLMTAALRRIQRSFRAS